VSLDWARDGADWPNRSASRFVRAGGLDWHVQVMGQGAPLLLVHGTGASTHSWRDLMPLLARDFTVVAPDLPGHGFTSTAASPRRQSLPGMARGVRDLLAALGLAPVAAAGHSAGAAIIVRMSLDAMMAPDALISLNGALMPWGGAAARLLSPVAQLIAASPLMPRFFAWRASNRSVVDRLLRGTGSTIDAVGADLYARMARDPDHVAAALGMMANWEPGGLAADLAGLKPRLTLIVGANDGTIPPSQARAVHRIVPGSVLISLPGLGHLAHEEQPAEHAALIAEAVRESRVAATVNL
jgi:magnesium chelatase accessory protein